MAAREKDCWDKGEIVAKFIGPIVIAVGAAVWGYAQTRIQSNAAESQAHLQPSSALGSRGT